MTVSLLCLPCAGASAGMYLRWRRWLPGWVRLVPVELPGRGTRTSDAFIDNFDALVAHLCEVHQQESAGSYALFGHSMGGLIAHAMAMYWRDNGRRMPEALFVSASPSPKHRDASYFADKETDSALIADLRKQGGTPREVFEDPQMLRSVLDTLRADYRVCSGYRARHDRPLAVPLHVFAGRQDDIESERILAWESETSAQFSVRWFEGGHFFIRQSQSAVLSAVTHHLSGDIVEAAHESAVGA